MGGVWSAGWISTQPAEQTFANKSKYVHNLFNIFIYFSSLHVSRIYVPIIRIKLLNLCDTGICHSVWVVTGLLVGVKYFQSNQQTRRHPYRVINNSVA